MIILIGDTHGNWDRLNALMLTSDVIGSTFIHVGDLGLGFRPELEAEKIAIINLMLGATGNKLYAIRGNHDNPMYWRDADVRDKFMSDYENIILVEDNATHIIEDQHIFFCGGAISIDRTARVEGVDYWSGEGIVLEKDKIPDRVDIVVTHSAPNFVNIGGDIRYWLKKDSSLSADLIQERNLLDELYTTIKPRNWYFGHFHQSLVQYVHDGNGSDKKFTRFTCLDIDEMKEYISKGTSL